MNGPQIRPVRLQLSLGGMCRIVGLVAVLFACLLPLKQADPVAFVSILLSEPIMAPVVLALAVQVIVPRGVLRLWLTRFLLALPFSYLLGTSVLLGLGVTVVNLRTNPPSVLLLFAWVIGFAASFGLGSMLVRIGRPLVPDRCPVCGRRRVFPDIRPANDRRFGALTVGRCVACGARFERWLRGTWQLVDPHPARCNGKATLPAPLDR